MKGGALQRQRRPLRPSECRRIHSDQRQRLRRQTGEVREATRRGSGKDDVRGRTSDAARTQETG